MSLQRDSTLHFLLLPGGSLCISSVLFVGRVSEVTPLFPPCDFWFSSGKSTPSQLFTLLSSSVSDTLVSKGREVSSVEGFSWVL